MENINRSEQSTRSDRLFAKMRKMAEDHLNDLSMEEIDIDSMSREEIRQIIQELRISQVQLGMQNEELRRTQIHLEEAKSRYFDLFELAPAGYISIDPNNIILEANLTACIILATERSGLLKKPFFLYINSEDHQIFYQNIRTIFKKQNSRVWESRLKSDKGAPTWVRLEGAYKMLEQGPVCRIIISDITEQKKREQDLKIAREQAEVASRTKSEFLANMSHEIRTPLNGIMGMLQILKSTSLNDSQKEYLELSLKASHRLTSLLSDILDLSSYENNLAIEYSEKFSMYELKDSIEQLFMPSAREKGLKFSCFCDKQVPEHFQGDRVRINQILVNIVGNAFKFTSNGKISLNVTTQPAESAGYVKAVFVIQDSGIGIPPEHIDNVFQAFRQAESFLARSFEGAGLGLTLASRAVNLLNGTINISSTPDRGTMVRIEIPLRVV